MTEIGAFEAKNQFSRLLDRAKNGEAFTITHRGVAVARLIPARQGPEEAAARATLVRLRHRARQGDGPPITIDEILEWRAAGRR